jgi:hypothetical protein
MVKLPIMKGMEGLTAKEMADILGITYDNCRKRISKAKVKPITKDAIYSPDALEIIRNVEPVGRPKKVSVSESNSEKPKKKK